MTLPMKTAIFLTACLTVAAAEPPATAIPPAFRGFRMPPSAPLRFLASEQGRAYLQATGHPLAPYAIRAFGATTSPAANIVSTDSRPADVEAPASSSCTGNAGTRFNLEPR